jgi:LysR family cyn operon transcriptional activator
METRQLHYFLAVCDELHFTRAAERLGISQPTLSQQIRVLEDELSIPLFDRIGKRIALTEAGALLKDYAARMILNERNAKAAIDELRSFKRGTIRLGVLPSDLDYRLTPLFIKFHDEFPHIRLQVTASTLLREQVLDNSIDIALSLQGPRDPLLVEEVLGREFYHLIVRSDHPLAGRASVELPELRQLPLVMYLRGYIGRELVEARCRELGFELEGVRMETGSATSLLQLVRAGIGGTIQPGSLLRQSTDTSLRSIPIVNNPPYRELQLIYRADRYISQAAHIFIERLKAFEQEHWER